MTSLSLCKVKQALLLQIRLLQLLLLTSTLHNTFIERVPLTSQVDLCSAPIPSPSLAMERD
jgi:hypothetical protein